jgi:hypothetical protein
LSIFKNTNKDLACPYCCEFTAKGGSAEFTVANHMDLRHMDCISVQKVEMPKDA